MNRPMATYREPHYPDKLERADDEVERVVRISVEWIIVALFVAMIVGTHIGIGIAERAQAAQVAP